MSYDLLIRATPSEQKAAPARSRPSLLAQISAIAGVRPNGDALLFGDGNTHWMDIRLGESAVSLAIPYGFLSEQTAPDYVATAWQIADAIGWTELVDEQNGQLVPREGPLAFRVPRIAHPFNRKPIPVVPASEAGSTRSREHDEALVGARDVDPARIVRALELALGDLGFTQPAAPEAGAAPGTFTLYRRERTVYLRGQLTRTLARGLAARAAAHLAGFVDVFHVQARVRENEKPACRVDPYEARVDENARFGSLDFSVLERIRWSSEQLDTDKPWRLTDASIVEAYSAWIPSSLDSPIQAETWHWSAPAALADARLEAIVVALRTGARAERTLVQGRLALRLRALDGTTTISVVSDEQLEALRRAWPALAL